MFVWCSVPTKTKHKQNQRNRDLAMLTAIPPPTFLTSTQQFQRFLRFSAIKWIARDRAS